ncbi:serine hydrolase domain-containing protein [Azospirillum sp.]|uniref:serine hydrolase domain-containing protein n=1 Tax=Azospirillum sp. TaxID=34012 RepID=UPI003D70E965
MTRILALFIFLTLPVSARADADAILRELLARYAAPGGVLLVSSADRRDLAVAGVADLRSKRPVTAQTRFHVASVGKMLTAVAVLRLVQEGRAALSDPAAALVGHPAAVRLTNLEGATLADLLAHRSGVPDCLRNSALVSAVHPGPRWTAEEVIESAPCRKPTPPGAYAYSNTNYILLGHILERIDGKPFAEALAERVLRPAGMADTSVGADPNDPGVAHGYRRPDARGVRSDASVVAYASPLGDAPVTTTAADLERFANALFRAQGTLLLPDLVKEMVTDRAGEDTDEGYGYGIVVEESDWGPRWGHAGRYAGFRAEFWYFPKRDTLLVLMMNGDENTDDDVGALIAERVFGR